VLIPARPRRNSASFCGAIRTAKPQSFLPFQTGALLVDHLLMLEGEF
jgi:hypothetical protein